jgi:hypothetical protein
MGTFIDKVPQPILIGSGALLLWAIYMWVRMMWEAQRLLGHFDRLLEAWASIKPFNRDDRVFGLDTRTVDGIRQRCNSLKGVAASHPKRQ